MRRCAVVVGLPTVKIAPSWKSGQKSEPLSVYRYRLPVPIIMQGNKKSGIDLYRILCRISDLF